MKYSPQNCCDKTIDYHIVLYRESYLPSCTKSWGIKLFLLYSFDEITKGNYYCCASQPFWRHGPFFAETLILGPLHENFFQNSWPGVNYGDETILTLTISSGTRDPKSQTFLSTLQNLKERVRPQAHLSASRTSQWSYWSVESAPTRPYVCNTWSPHLPWVCGTHNSNPGLKMGEFLEWNATIMHFWLS